MFISSSIKVNFFAGQSITERGEGMMNLAILLILDWVDKKFKMKNEDKQMTTIWLLGSYGISNITFNGETI